MTVGGTASIFRITTTGQTEDTDEVNNSIEFGTGALNPDARSHLESARIEYDNDISIHPNPNRQLSQIQDGKLGTQIITLRGYFYRPSSAGGITRLFSWMTTVKANASLPFGRFGIRVDNMSQLDLTPSAIAAYIVKKIWVEDITEFQSRANFEVVLYRNGAVS